MHNVVDMVRRARWGGALLLVLAIAVAGFMTPRSVHAATIQVTNENDSGAGSLRAAITSAAPNDTITFAAGVTTITLTSGDLSISNDLTIDGGATGVTIQRDRNAGQFRIFTISGATTDVIFEHLTIRNGKAPDSSSGAGGNGGAIALTGNSTLTIIESTLSNNRAGNGADSSSSGGAGGDGGGIFHSGSALTIVNSALSNNQAGDGGSGGSGFGGRGGDGGGIFISNGLLTVVSSTLSDNQSGAGGSSNTIGGAGGGGGGIYTSSGTITIAESTFSNNQTGDGGGSTGFGGDGGDGGGIFHGGGTLALTNSTLSGNQTGEGGDGSASTDGGDGGGIYTIDGAVQLINSTLSDNQATANGEGGGMYNESPLLLANSIIAGSSPNDVEPVATVDTEGNNIISDTSLGPSSRPTLLVNTDPQLGPLQDNGGPTFTQVPQPTSPAIDAGRNAIAFPLLTTDQRSFARIANGTIDIGAVEVGGGDSAYTITASPTSINEDASSATRTAVVRVARSGTTTASSSVDVIIGGTALPDEDYTSVLITDGASLTDSTLTFESGTAEALFIIAAQTDAVAESDEDIILTLTNPTAPETATINTAQVVITIIDDPGDDPDNSSSPNDTVTNNPVIYLPFLAR
jgi:hypothetical protein